MTSDLSTRTCIGICPLFIQLRFNYEHWRTQHTGIQGMPCTLGLGAPIQFAECGGMTEFNANVNQHAANTSPRNLAAHCANLHATKRRISQLTICGAHLSSNKHAPFGTMSCTFDNSWVRHSLWTKAGPTMAKANVKRKREVMRRM